MKVSKESARIKGLFAGISRRYDLINHLLSLNTDSRWRRRTARELALAPGDRVLDVCTGTADLALELCRHVSDSDGGHVIGTDFCEEMVQLGEEKRRKRDERRLTLLVADTLRLPFGDATFDAVTVSFGIRNVCDLDGGLREMCRILRPGGRCAILEFTTPKSGLLRRLYHIYFHRVLPHVGRLVSGSPHGGEAYSYLPESVKEFPGPDVLADQMRDAGFAEVRYRLLSAGIAALHVARRGAV